MTLEQFSGLLVKGIHAIKSKEHKSIRIIQDEIGYALERTGGSMVEHWCKPKGSIPQSITDIENLAKIIIERSGLDRQWLLAFLVSAGHPQPEAFCRQLFPGFSWGELRQACSRITQKRTEALKNKYDKALYQPRQNLRAEFESFLTSDSQFFVLIGKTGIGKSSFLYNLLDEQAAWKDEASVLMYEGRSFLPLHVQVSDTFIKTCLVFCPIYPKMHRLPG